MSQFKKLLSAPNENIESYLQLPMMIRLEGGAYAPGQLKKLLKAMDPELDIKKLPVYCCEALDFVTASSRKYTSFCDDESIYVVYNKPANGYHVKGFLKELCCQITKRQKELEKHDFDKSTPKCWDFANSIETLWNFYFVESQHYG